MVKKAIVLLLFVGLIAGLTLTTGCSKRMQTLAGVSVGAGATCGAVLLNGHVKRNNKRKRKINAPIYRRLEFK